MKLFLLVLAVIGKTFDWEISINSTFKVTYNCTVSECIPCNISNCIQSTFYETLNCVIRDNSTGIPEHKGPPTTRSCTPPRNASNDLYNLMVFQVSLV